MLNLTVAPWELVLRAVIVYFAVMLLIRMSGKRTIGEFTPFDMVVLLLVAESTQGALIGNDGSIAGGLIVCATLIGLNFLIGFLSARFRFVDRLVEGEPVVLIRHGQVFSRALRRHNLPQSDLDEALRRNGIATAAEVDLAMLENDGKISVVRRAQ
jgi:uncharacterized membrane protein YcaP (DUF421 family)